MTERVKRKLTMSQMLEVGRLRRRWPSATDEERKKIEARIREIEHGDKEEPPKRSQQNPEQKASGQANPSSKEKPDNDEYVAPDEGMPHMSYCACTEIMVMVDTANGWMSYDKFRETHPNQTVFDINPDKITVMYLNHDKYREILETVDDVQLDQRNVIAHCARLLPEDIRPIEVTILSGLLCVEAWYDPRISELGYKLGSMQECEECGLFEDFFNGVIYNVLHSNMTLEEARYFAEHGKLPDSEEQQPVAERQSGNVVNGKPVDKGNRGHQQNGRNNGHNQRNQSNGQNRSNQQNKGNGQNHGNGQNGKHGSNKGTGQNRSGSQNNRNDSQNFAMLTL